MSFRVTEELSDEKRKQEMADDTRFLVPMKKPVLLRAGALLLGKRNAVLVASLRRTTLRHGVGGFAINSWINFIHPKFIHYSHTRTFGRRLHYRLFRI